MNFSAICLNFCFIFNCWTNLNNSRTYLTPVCDKSPVHLIQKIIPKYLTNESNCRQNQTDSEQVEGWCYIDEVQHEFFVLIVLTFLTSHEIFAGELSIPVLFNSTFKNSQTHLLQSLWEESVPRQRELQVEAVELFVQFVVKSSCISSIAFDCVI